MNLNVQDLTAIVIAVTLVLILLFGIDVTSN
jgi:hypothetical protein